MPRGLRARALLLTLLAGLAAGAALVQPAGAGVRARSARPLLVTATRAGRVHLGELASTLIARHLIGKIRPGCPLGGSNTRSARLSRPLAGTVDFTLSSPRRVQDISVTGGGVTARGIAIGASLKAVKRAYPKAHIDNSTVATFGVISILIPRSEGGPLQLDVDHKSKRLIIIGAPFVATCD